MKLEELGAESDRVQQVLRHIREHLSGDLSIETLAGVARLRPRQFSRVFREETGQSPAKAVEHLRLETARLMVETTRHPMEIVAQGADSGTASACGRRSSALLRQTPQMIRRMPAQSALAVQQPSKPMAVKSEMQQATLALHRMRQQLIKFRTMQINGLRGLLTEYGKVMSKSRETLNKTTPTVFERIAQRSPAALIDMFRE